MALDHYVSQVHLKNFYAAALGERMYAIQKANLKTFQCDSASQCRIEENSTNPYLQEPRAIEDFLKDVEPRYNASLEKLRANSLDPEAIYAIAGFASYIAICSPAAMRIHAEPIQKTVELTALMMDSRGEFGPAPAALGGKPLTELLGNGEVKIAIDPKYPQSMGIENIIRRVSVWGNSSWDILLNDDISSPFFTSDFPIAIERSDDPRILYWVIPLAPDLAIRIRPDIKQRDKLDLEFKDLRTKLRRTTKQEIVHLNTGIVRCAETTVYMSHDSSWVPKFVRKHQEFRVEPETTKIPMGSKSLLVSTMRIRPNSPVAVR